LAGGRFAELVVLNAEVVDSSAVNMYRTTVVNALPALLNKPSHYLWHSGHSTNANVSFSNQYIVHCL